MFNSIKRILEPRPLHKQVRDAILQQINEEKYEDGMQIPSETKLSEMFGVSRNTIREAIKVLCQEGVLVSRQGLGTFVIKEKSKKSLGTNIIEIESITNIISNFGLAPGIADFALYIEPVDSALAKRLCIEEQETVVIIERIRTADGKKIIYIKDYIINLDGLVELYEQERPISLYVLLEENYGLKVDYAVCRIQAISADQRIAEKMEIPIDYPLLFFEQTHYTSKGKPVFYSHNMFITESFTFYAVRKRA